MPSRASSATKKIAARCATRSLKLRTQRHPHAAPIQIIGRPATTNSTNAKWITSMNQRMPAWQGTRIAHGSRRAYSAIDGRQNLDPHRLPRGASTRTQYLHWKSGYPAIIPFSDSVTGVSHRGVPSIDAISVRSFSAITGLSRNSRFAARATLSRSGVMLPVTGCREFQGPAHA